MSRQGNELHKAISRLSGAEGTIHLAEMQESSSREQERDLVDSDDFDKEEVGKDSLDKANGPAVVGGDLEANKAFELTDQTLVSGTRILDDAA